MKKTYIAPGMEIVNVQTDAMLAESMDLNRETVSGNSALSRKSGGSFWDDEEDY
ncbi:MAG: hypothetical protein IKQ59_05545 [Prevotella sp.]|nr:hypothetical protein [Prevotella sp.]